MNRNRTVHPAKVILGNTISHTISALPSLLYSITIDTPEKLKLVRLGHYNGKTVDLEITAAADASVFLLVEEFANSTEFEEITFRREGRGGDRITISPANPAEVQIIWWSSGQLPLDILPKHYKKYEMWFQGVAATTQDLDKMLQWQSATELHFFDNGDLALLLFQNVWKLRTLPALERLYFWVNKVAMDQINVATFIENIPTLKYLHITGGGNYRTELKAFRDKNRIDGWYYGGYPYSGETYYVKKSY